MRASPPDGRRPRERCCATTLSINTSLWISPVVTHSSKHCLRPYCPRAFLYLIAFHASVRHTLIGHFKGRVLRGRKSSTARPACRSASGSSVYSSSSAFRSDTRSLGSAVPVGGPIAVIDRASGPGRLESGQARPRRRRVHTVLWAPGGGRVDLDEPGDTPQSRTLPAPVRWKCGPAGLRLGGLERVNFDPHARTTRPRTENALVVQHRLVSPHSQCP
jgi:hypothetical protein